MKRRGLGHCFRAVPVRQIRNRRHHADDIRAFIKSRPGMYGAGATAGPPLRLKEGRDD
jgi:hypothetical protein